MSKSTDDSIWHKKPVDDDTILMSKQQFENSAIEQYTDKEKDER